MGRLAQGLLKLQIHQVATVADVGGRGGPQALGFGQFRQLSQARGGFQLQPADPAFGIHTQNAEGLTNHHMFDPVAAGQASELPGHRGHLQQGMLRLRQCGTPGLRVAQLRPVQHALHNGNQVLRDIRRLFGDELVDQAPVEGADRHMFVGLAGQQIRPPGQSVSSVSACRPSMPGMA